VRLRPTTAPDLDYVLGLEAHPDAAPFIERCPVNDTSSLCPPRTPRTSWSSTASGRLGPDPRGTSAPRSCPRTAADRRRSQGTGHRQTGACAGARPRVRRSRRGSGVARRRPRERARASGLRRLWLCRPGGRRLFAGGRLVPPRDVALGEELVRAQSRCPPVGLGFSPPQQVVDSVRLSSQRSLACASVVSGAARLRRRRHRRTGRARPGHTGARWRAGSGRSIVPTGPRGRDGASCAAARRRFQVILSCALA
jgi:hypothetical protein